MMGTWAAANHAPSPPVARQFEKTLCDAFIFAAEQLLPHRKGSSQMRLRLDGKAELAVRIANDRMDRGFDLGLTF